MASGYECGAGQRAGQRGDRAVFYIRECPHKERCSDEAWGSARFPSSTENGAIDMLKKHLMDSRFHQLGETDAQLLAEQAPVESYIDKCRASRDKKPEQKKQDAGNGAGEVLAFRPPARSRSPLPRTTGGTKDQTRDENLAYYWEKFQFNAENVASQLENVARTLKDQAQMNVASGSGERPIAMKTEFPVPQSIAKLLKQSLLRATESSKQMRTALENYEKIAQQNEALLERAQQMLSLLLERDD